MLGAMYSPTYGVKVSKSGSSSGRQQPFELVVHKLTAWKAKNKKQGWYVDPQVPILKSIIQNQMKLRIYLGTKQASCAAFPTPSQPFPRSSGAENPNAARWMFSKMKIR